MWHHTRGRDRFVTAVIDLTAVHESTSRARLLDMARASARQTLGAWLPQATAVLDPFHVLHLAGDDLDRRPRRVQQQLYGHRGLSSDPLYRERRLLRTDTALLTDR